MLLLGKWYTTRIPCDAWWLTQLIIRRTTLPRPALIGLGSEFTPEKWLVTSRRCPMLPLTLGTSGLLGRALPSTLAYVTRSDTGALSRRVALPESFIYIPPRLVCPDASRVKTVTMMNTTIMLSRTHGQEVSWCSTMELVQ